MEITNTTTLDSPSHSAVSLEVPRWPHQRQAHAATIAAIEMGERAICVTSPTGGGKTMMQSDLIRWALERSWRVVLYTHRKILLDQLSNTLSQYGISHGLRASDHQADLLSNVQVSSIQTELSRVYKTERWRLHPAKLVIIDEAHNNASDTAERIIQDHMDSGAAVVGYTATPLGIGHIYKKLIVAGTNSQLRECGALVEAITYGPDEPDTRHIKRLPSGEFSEKEVRKVFKIQQVFGRIFEWWKRLNPDMRPTIVFTPGVPESVWVAQKLESLGVRAAHIDGEDIYLDGKSYESSPAAREDMLAQVRDGRIKVVTNRFVMREGVNVPELYHCILATPFGGLQSYLQAGGRILRNHPSLPGHVIVQDHGGCLDSETEILTKRGWVGRTGISDNDEVAGFDCATGEISWQRILHRHDRPLEYGEEMYEVRGRSTNIRVTGNHRIVHKRRTCTADNVPVWPKKFVLRRADELASQGGRFKIPTAGIEIATGVPLTDAELSFIGWFVTDGCMTKRTGHDPTTVSITQANHQPHIVQLRECLVGCGFDFVERRRKIPSQFSTKPHTVFSVPKGTCRSKPRRGWFRLAPYLDKNLSPLLDNVTSEQFKVLLHAIHLGDGAKGRRPGSYSISTGNRLFADRLQSLCIRRGYKCDISIQKHKTLYSQATLVLNVQTTNHTTIHGNRVVGGQAQFRKSMSREGERVWCVANPLQTLVTRRRGKVAIIGNSWHRHGSLNADREWDLSYTNNMVTGLREQAMREKREQEPIVCPKCGRVRQAGKQCGECGWENPRKTRIIMEHDGTLREMHGDIYKPRRVRTYKGIEDDWKRMYYRGLSRCKKGNNCTFVALEALFAKENHWNFPPRTLPLMPVDAADWYRSVSEVPRDRLR